MKIEIDVEEFAKQEKMVRVSPLKAVYSMTL